MVSADHEYGKDDDGEDDYEESDYESDGEDSKSTEAHFKIIPFWDIFAVEGFVFFGEVGVAGDFLGVFEGSIEPADNENGVDCVDCEENLK